MAAILETLDSDDSESDLDSESDGKRFDSCGRTVVYDEYGLIRAFL